MELKVIDKEFSVCKVSDFSEIGILSKISTCLAENDIGIFAISTFNTNYVLTKENDFSKAIEALKLPDHIAPLCDIIIGYPAENPTPKDKWKPENVSYNEFGGKAE